MPSKVLSYEFSEVIFPYNTYTPLHLKNQLMNLHRSHVVQIYMVSYIFHIYRFPIRMNPAETWANIFWAILFFTTVCEL